VVAGHTPVTGLAERIAAAEAPPERSKLHVPVVDALEADIFSGALKVGDRIPSEAAIAKAFNVSTRSVREAIQVLETKGLLRRRHGERAEVVRDDVGEFIGSLAVTVKQLFSQNPAYIEQLMQVRRMIELEAVDHLTAGESNLNAETEQAIAGMRAASETGDQARFAQCDADFHLGIVRSVGNEILSVFYANMFALITELIRVSNRVPRKPLKAAYDEHAEIYTLIHQRDTERARTALRAHIDNSASYLAIARQNANMQKPGAD
jgi:GntR family transcriptional regulator, transcriptional repressor for pyruvate dehydrogenase complex